MGRDRMTESQSAKPASSAQPDEQDLLQIRERLEWTPEERLSYLRDMILFEELAHTARRI